MGTNLLLYTMLDPDLDPPLTSKLRESRRSSYSQATHSGAGLAAQEKAGHCFYQKQSAAAQLMGGIVPFSVCLAPQLLTSKQCIFISVSIRGSIECFLETPCTFYLLVYLVKVIPQVTDTSGFINPSLLSSLLQAVLLQLWKSPFDCSQFASLAFAQPGVIPQIFYLERERKKERCSLREQRKGCSY